MSPGWVCASITASISNLNILLLLLDVFEASLLLLLLHFCFTFEYSVYIHSPCNSYVGTGHNTFRKDLKHYAKSYTCQTKNSFTTASLKRKIPTFLLHHHRYPILYVSRRNSSWKSYCKLPSLFFFHAISPCPFFLCRFLAPFCLNMTCLFSAYSVHTGLKMAVLYALRYVVQ